MYYELHGDGEDVTLQRLKKEGRRFGEKEGMKINEALSVEDVQLMQVNEFMKFVCLMCEREAKLELTDLAKSVMKSLFKNSSADLIVDIESRLIYIQELSRDGEMKAQEETQKGGISKEKYQSRYSMIEQLQNKKAETKAGFRI